jgi:hypothetical protein
MARETALQTLEAAKVGVLMKRQSITVSTTLTSVAFAFLGLMPLSAAAEINHIQDNRFKVTQVLANEVVRTPARSSFKWASIEDRRDQKRAGDTTPANSIERWATRDRSGANFASTTIPVEGPMVWGVESTSMQQGFRWGLRSTSEQQGFRWGLRSTSEQQGFRWGLRNTSEQQGFRWGLRNASEQQGFRWGLRSRAQQQSFPRNSY